MTKTEKVSLLKYLYINDDVMTFLCNDLFQELMNYISYDKCVCRENVNSSIREKNYSEAIETIRNFLTHNKDYDDITKKIFSHYKREDIEIHLLLGFVFFISIEKDIDIFRDEQSICFTEGPILFDLID